MVSTLHILCIAFSPFQQPGEPPEGATVMNNGFWCLILAFSVACSSAQQTESNHPAVARPERVRELRKIVNELIKLEPQISLVEQDGKKNVESLAAEMSAQLDAVKDRCDADSSPKLRTQDDRKWCALQVIDLCQKMARLAPLDIAHQFRLKDVYAQWFEVAQPLMLLLADEYLDQTKFGVTLEYGSQMTSELVRLVDAIIPCGSCELEPREWDVNRRTFIAIYKRRWNAVENITPQWRAETEAKASSICPLLESTYIMLPILNDVKAMMNQIGHPKPH